VGSRCQYSIGCRVLTRLANLNVPLSIVAVGKFRFFLRLRAAVLFFTSLSPASQDLIARRCGPGLPHQMMCCTKDVREAAKGSSSGPSSSARKHSATATTGVGVRVAPNGAGVGSNSGGVQTSALDFPGTSKTSRRSAGAVRLQGAVVGPGPRPRVLRRSILAVDSGACQIEIPVRSI